MATNTVTVSGMFGNGTYFAGSPVVIRISELAWPKEPNLSPFTIVRVHVLDGSRVIGKFKADTGQQTSISFDISSALRALWNDYKFNNEVSAANSHTSHQRLIRSYSLKIFTEYINSDGEFTQTESGVKDGGRCVIGWMTEWERSHTSEGSAGVAHLAANTRNGKASTKPTSTPERVGSESITSWVSVDDNYTTSVFYAKDAGGGSGSSDSASQHAPLVLRDSQPYTDFLFVNRRGAVETCSAPTKESMDVEVDTQNYARIERPTFQPSRSLMAIAKGGRRSWSMSSGPQTREWADWWAEEFLMARQWWMRYKGSYVPVIVEPAKKKTSIYDRSKQNMPSVEFTVTLALEG